MRKLRELFPSLFEPRKFDPSKRNFLKAAIACILVGSGTTACSIPDAEEPSQEEGFEPSISIAEIGPPVDRTSHFSPFGTCREHKFSSNTSGEFTALQFTFGSQTRFSLEAVSDQLRAELAGLQTLDIMQHYLHRQCQAAHNPFGIDQIALSLPFTQLEDNGLFTYPRQTTCGFIDGNESLGTRQESRYGDGLYLSTFENNSNIDIISQDLRVSLPIHLKDKLEQCLREQQGCRTVASALLEMLDQNANDQIVDAIAAWIQGGKNRIYTNEGIIMPLPEKEQLAIFVDNYYTSNACKYIIDAIFHITLPKFSGKFRTFNSTGGIVLHQGTASLSRGELFIAQAIVSKEKMDRGFMMCTVSFNAQEWREKWNAFQINYYQEGKAQFGKRIALCSLYVLPNVGSNSTPEIWMANKHLSINTFVEAVFSKYPNALICFPDQNIRHLMPMFIPGEVEPNKIFGPSVAHWEEEEQKNIALSFTNRSFYINVYT